MSQLYSQPKGRRYKTPTITHQLIQATGSLRTIIAEGTPRSMYRAVIQLARRLKYANPKALANAAKMQLANQSTVTVCHDPRHHASYLIQPYRRTKLIALKIAKGSAPKDPEARLEALGQIYNDVINNNLYEANKAAWIEYMRHTVPQGFRQQIHPDPANDVLDQPPAAPPPAGGVWQEGTGTGRIQIDDPDLAPYAEDVRRRLDLLPPPHRRDYNFDLAPIALEQTTDIEYNAPTERPVSKGTASHVRASRSLPTAVKAINAMIPNTKFAIPGIKVYTATQPGPDGTEVPLQVHYLGPKPTDATKTGYDKYYQKLFGPPDHGTTGPN